MAKKGKLLVALSAPEMKAQLSEFEAKALAIQSQKAEFAQRFIRPKPASGQPGGGSRTANRESLYEAPLICSRTFSANASSSSNSDAITASTIRISTFVY